MSPISMVSPGFNPDAADLRVIHQRAADAAAVQQRDNSFAGFKRTVFPRDAGVLQFRGGVGSAADDQRVLVANRETAALIGPGVR